jgi:hypothetical protein
MGADLNSISKLAIPVKQKTESGLAAIKAFWDATDEALLAKKP